MLVSDWVPEIFGLLASFVHLNIPTKINLPKKRGGHPKIDPSKFDFSVANRP